MVGVYLCLAAALDPIQSSFRLSTPEKESVVSMVMAGPSRPVGEVSSTFCC
jgi:hypothetical protein